MSKWYQCVYCTEDLHCTKYADDDSESWCVLGPCTAETPSNGDKIRCMTDEELAEFLCKWDSCQSTEGLGYNTLRVGNSYLCDAPGGGDIRGECQVCALEWLKQEAT